MKTKQSKEDLDKSIDEDTAIEPKTRARKKASDIADEDKNKPSQDEPKTSKETKKPIAKPKTIVKKKPLGIRKTLRSKKAAVAKEKTKKAIRTTVTRARKAAIKTEPDNSQEKETVPLIPASEIKKEPVDDSTPDSRSSSPRTAGRRQRLSSDMIMMKTLLADPPSSLVLGPRTSPYSMRSERSNSPSLFEGKNLRSGKPRKVKNNLLNEVVMKEQQKKRRRLLSDTKTDAAEVSDDGKKPKRGRSCSRDGSEFSKCSDITESDLSMSESLNDTDSKELNKKLDKPKTDLDIDIENNVQISTIEKVPSLNVDSKLDQAKPETETSSVLIDKKKKTSLKRSTSLDSDNNNSNRLKIESLNSSDVEDKSLMKTETDTLFAARSSILTSMSKTFNSKEVSKNIRKARRGRKAAASARPSASSGAKNDTTTIANDSTEDKQETLESLSKEIDDLINNLDQNIDGDRDIASDTKTVDDSSEQMQTKPVSKFYGISKPLGDNNSIVTPETPVKDKDSLSSITTESTPSKTDDSENIRLHYEEDSMDKPTDSSKQEKTYKCTAVASIDLLMDRLKEFEEFDKRRQRQESESKSGDSKSVMVTNDVVLIPKSGADIKLKDIQTVRSPERPFEKENVLSCFENNSAISIVKREQFRRSIDIDLPNSVTLIKRNSISARKESTSSNHSKESDAISIFEKSLGKDVTLTEIRKSVDKQPTTPVEVHPFATLHPNNPNQTIVGVVLDPKQISITPRVMTDSKISSGDVSKRASRESLTRKSSETVNEPEEKMATIEKIKSPRHQVMSSAISITATPVAIKSPEAPQPMATEALAPPLENVKAIPEDIALASEVSKVPEVSVPTPEATKVDSKPITGEKLEIPKEDAEKIAKPTEKKPAEESSSATPELQTQPEKMEVEVKPEEKPDLPKVAEPEKPAETKPVEVVQPVKVSPPVKVAQTVKTKSARNSLENQPGPSNVLLETPESQKRKENVLRTLGLLTHKAAKEAKIEKLKEKERIYNGMMSNKKQVVKSGDYTGTLKTVIKLNRGTGDRDKKRYRSSLKMTFQKSKHRSGKPTPEPGEATRDDEAYYTIERREGGAGAASDGGHRKSYSNRLNNHEAEIVPEPVEAKETLNLVIPEKASSFSIHPGRLCMDQCFYCGGKFGLFDTPCHIAQMKSSERQKKVLDNEEKLTIDSCLCDACYRHVDRRANCPSYRKRPFVKQPPDLTLTPPLAQTQTDKPVSPSLEDESEEEGPPSVVSAAASGRPALCHTAGCAAAGEHSIRRKWLIKMRAGVNRILKLQGDYPGLHTIPLCGEHYRSLAPLMACVLCRRRVTKHHNVHTVHAYQELNPLLKEASIPVEFRERPVLCKVCRYYCTLLQRPGLNDAYARGYRRKLLQIYNIEVPPESDHETEEPSLLDDGSASGKQKKKTRTKSKQRKSTEPEKLGDSESSEKTESSSPEKDKVTEVETQKAPIHPLEEDIESLISSNKILVPGAKIQDLPPQSDSSEDTVYDFDPLLPVDKQTELQYLLQKQNNPAQFLHKPPNLTQTIKQGKTNKILNVGIQKPGHDKRIHDKNAKRIHKLGQIVAQLDKGNADIEMFDADKCKEMSVFKNIPLSEECTIESIPNKRPADINTLKNKWQMSESFTQVKKNLSELSKKFTVEKEPKKSYDAKYSNPVKRLETNPSISVRELFPGEEEMNLQCNIEFNSVKGVTPEGWEKCNTMIQYDEETKKLWTELQRPYGNQSSFLRHLILLEKYFRSGDLVLSHTATPHAANYSDSVQSRLRAYDNVASDAPRRSEPAINLIEYRKKPSVNGKSLLKNNHESDKDTKKFMPPPGMFPKKSVKDKTKSKALPPELIAINTPSPQGRKAIQNVLHNIQQLVKGVSASDPTEVAAAPLPPPPKYEPPKYDPPKYEPPKAPEPPPNPPKDKKESKSDTPKKPRPTSKPWRPTLMPITPENMSKIAREPTQVAVDGRHLPSLVQVMSSGKRYHITLQDYNKMCIMRREKLQQIQDGDPKKRSEETVVTEIQTSTMLGNGGTLLQTIEKDTDRKEMPELSQISSNAANILKNVGLKNITIAPITPKTATVTSQTIPMPVVSSPSLLVTSTPMKLPQLGPAVSITSETILTPNLPIMSSGMIMPKIPKSLTVIPQTVMTSLPNVVMTQNVVVPQSMVLPHNVVMTQSPTTTQMVVQTAEGPRP